MTEKEKEQIREQFRASADIQAKAMIDAVEQVDKQLPADITCEERAKILNNIIMQSGKIVIESTNALAEQMKKTKPEVKND